MQPTGQKGSPVRPPDNEPQQPALLAGGQVQRLLGKAPEEWQLADLVHLAREREIRIVSLMHVGGDGWLKSLDFLPHSELHLMDVLSAGERADGSSLFAETGISSEASDITLRPRISSAFLHPFSPLPTLVFLCEHLGRDGQPLKESPDTIVRLAHSRLVAETDLELWALGEVEYFLGRIPAEGSSYGRADRGYHATSPFVFGESLRRRAMGILGDIGVGVKYGHSEVGYIEASERDELAWEQHEIELALAPLPMAADAVVLSQWVLRNLAHESRIHCSFSPILRHGHAGSGMHFHLSPRRNGKHLGGMDAEGRMSDEARWLIAGLVQMGGALMAFGNRRRESFIRLGQGKEVPRAITWGQFNRNALVRLPIQARTPEGRVVTPPTIEFRLPDGSVHPHLLLAGVAQALLCGREAKDAAAVLDRSRAVGSPDQDPGTSSVPRSFQEVAGQLELHRAALEAGQVFPPSMLDAILAVLHASD